MTDRAFIEVRGARENNLKDISLDIPKRKLTVFTGVSGSGESSLVFDTIAAEAQRQLNETLQFWWSSTIRMSWPWPITWWTWDREPGRTGARSYSRAATRPSGKATRLQANSSSNTYRSKRRCAGQPGG